MSPSEPAAEAVDLTSQAGEGYFVRHESQHFEWQPQILKHGDTFAVLNPYGDIITLGRPDEGLFHQDTRFLSHYELRINHARPLLLASSVTKDNTILHVHLTCSLDGDVEPEQNMHIFRSIYLWQGALHERLRLKNYRESAVSLMVQYAFNSDFADIFEVRGNVSRFRGPLITTGVKRGAVQIKYSGRDEVTRATRVAFDPQPGNLSPTSAVYSQTLEPRRSECFFVNVDCNSTVRVTKPASFASGLRAARRDLRAKRRGAVHIYTANELFNEWLNRSLADLYTLITDTNQGPYPYAGIPWFNTAFGRDGIITALQCLWMDPSIARGVLGYLAQSQAEQRIAESDAEPGKILHETRCGEMANLGEVPFKRYFGSVDSTPLFIVLAGEYFARTGDLEFIKSIWPSIKRALAWIDAFGDADGDGFVEYSRTTEKGLLNQGWKDSGDSVFHSDGTLAKGPVALCEVQGYVYAAKQAAARLSEALGSAAEATRLRSQAEHLQEAFEAAFWSDELGTYVLALDGAKRQCAVRSSNAGQLLMTGIVNEERAAQLADLLSSSVFYSGWGLRTLATTEARYNPMSYHNGSIWPHDNGLIAMGLARYDFKKPVMLMTRGLFEASTYLQLHRLPELFCGFSRRAATGPILYPNACAPQAWSSSTVLALLNALLDIRMDAISNTVRIRRPQLPAFLERVHLKGLRLGNGSLDLTFNRNDHDVTVVTDARDGDLDIQITA